MTSRALRSAPPPILPTMPPSSPAITVYVKSRIGLHTAEPFVDAFLEEGVAVHLVIDGTVENVVRETWGEQAASIQTIEGLTRRHCMAMRLHTRLYGLLTPLSCYPLQIRLKRELAGLPYGGGRQRWTAALNGLRPPPNQVNRLVGRTVGVFLRNPLPSKNILVISRPFCPGLLCGRQQRITTLTESWDHPAYQPMGFPTGKLVTWNRPLFDDWQEYQGKTEFVKGYPIKLHYAIEAREEQRAELSPDRRKQRRIMYPATYSSNSDMRFWEEEKQVVLHLCRAADQCGLPVMVKPKPNGLGSDFAFVRDAFPHVEISEAKDATDGNDYDLDADYNASRLRDMASSWLVINLGTTFALDAAAYGLPVLQLQIKDRQNFPFLSRLQEVAHIRRHLLDREGMVATVSAPEDISIVLTDLGQAESKWYPRSVQFSRQLWQWLAVDGSLHEAVQRIAAASLQTA